MVFTIGNILTLMIVFIILAIYRQLDKNNRSLTKIKKYSEKIKGELDSFVDGKTTEVKNLGIELSVHQQTGKEILKRIKSAEDELENRSASMSQINQRIAEYDKALAELHEMTGRVDENLNRLHKESEFVDKVSRQLSSTQDRINHLEKRLPAITNEFSEMNNKSLQEVSKKTFTYSQKLAAKVHEGIKDTSDRLVALDDQIKELEARREQFQSDALQQIQEVLDEKVYQAEKTGEQLQKELTESLRSEKDRISNESDEIIQKVERELNSLSGSAADMEETIQARISSFHERIQGIEGKYEETLQQVAERGSTLEHEAFARLKELIKQSIVDTKGKFQTGLAELKQNVEQENGQIAARQQEYFDSLTRKYTDLSSEAAAADGQARQKLSDLEQKLGDYEEQMGYRFSKMEEATQDIDSLEQNLRQAMDRVTARIRSEFQEFENQLKQEREGQRKDAQQDIQAVHNALAEVENQLAELKDQAAKNVSVKLQQFEQDFFQDLEDRTGRIDNRFEEWKIEMENHLSEMGGNQEAQRQRLETEYSDNLRDRLNELQTRIYAQQEKFENQVQGFQDRIQGRMDHTTQLLEGLEEELKTEIETAKQQTQAAFQKEFTDYQSAKEAQMKRSERELESALSELDSSVRERRAVIDNTVDTMQSDMNVWQTQIDQQMSAADEDIKTRYENIKKEIDDTVTMLKGEFESQRDDLILQTQDERTRLKNELKEISDRVLELETELQKKTDAAFDTFDREYENYMLELQKKNRELQLDLDKKIKDFRLIAQDTKDKTEQMQKKLFGKIEEGYTTLQVNLQEIDKHQKNFISQTKIFDRADSLKDTLQESIEDLKAEITRVQALNGEIRETEKKFMSIKKLGEEVTSKLNRFIAEKRRIEEMEGDFKKLINISQTIDMKLEQVTESHDSLQNIQATIRTLEELEQAVEQRYERLENKQKVIDTTIKQVDTTFQKADDLENYLKSIEEQAGEMPKRLEEVGQRIMILADNKQKVDQAIEQLEALDDLIQDTEERTERMQKAREWLAKTETRLEEINTQAKEQVKLLGSLLKSGKKGAKESEGAPSMGAREIVSRLAHQGWSVDEIARATKLSKGEVELILEIVPRK